MSTMFRLFSRGKNYEQVTHGSYLKIDGQRWRVYEIDPSMCEGRLSGKWAMAYCLGPLDGTEIDAEDMLRFPDEPSS